MAGRKGGVWRAIVALVCVAVLAGAVLGIRRFGLARRDPAISRDLVSTFASKDGDIVAHHPRELAADAIDESGVKLSGPAGASVTLDETNPAISNDVADLARAALDANRGAGIALTETSRSTATCHGQRALVVEAAVEENAVSRKLHACVFVAAGRSFTLAYLVRDDRTSDEAILLSVVEGAEIKSLVDAPKPASSGVPVVREGDIMASCKSEETACSADGKNLVQCHAGKPLLILRPCLGPSGCTLLAGDPRCDETIARAGDPCDPRGRIACSEDGRSELTCASNKPEPDPSPTPTTPPRPVPTYRGRPIYTPPPPPPKPVTVIVDKSTLVWGRARACKTACTVHEGRVQCD